MTVRGILLATFLSCACLLTRAEVPDTNAVNRVVRAFLTAAMTMEVEEVKRHALAHPELAILGDGQAPPAAVKREMRVAFGRASCRFLKAGESIRLPGGRELVVAAEAVSPDRCLVVPEVGGSPMPVPLAVVRTEAGWKVDATPIIAARKAAAARRGKR